MVIPRAGRRLQIGAQAGETEVAVAQDEHLAGHQEKPSACDRHHRVPNQPNGRVRQFQLPEALPCREAKDPGGFPELSRQALERGIEAEGHIPHLPGENQQDRAQLNAQLPPRNQRHHGQHHAGQKTQHRNRLQNIQHRDHEAFCARVVSGDVTVSHGEDQAQQVSDADAHHGIKSVQRQHFRRGRNGDRGHRMSHPILRNAQHRIKQAQPASGDTQVEKERPGPLQHQGAGKRRDAEEPGRLAHSACASSTASAVSSSSGRMNRLREASKSNSSA